MPATYPEILPDIAYTSLSVAQWGTFATDANNRYYFGFRASDNFITVIKTTDQGDTWAEMDAGGAKEIEAFAITFYVTPHADFPTLSSILYVVYVSVTDNFVHVAEFDTASDTWGTDWASAKGFSALSLAPDSQYNLWQCPYRALDGQIVIFGAFDAETVLGIDYWRVGYMIFDPGTGTFSAYTIPFGMGDETDYNTIGGASGVGGKTHLFYTEIVAATGVRSLKQFTLDFAGAVHPSQTISVVTPPTGINLYEWIGFIKSLELTPGGDVLVYFVHNRGEQIGIVDQEYTLSVVTAVSEDEPTWDTDDIKTVAYDGTDGVFLSTYMSFASGTVVSAYWEEKTYAGGVFQQARQLRVTWTAGAISAEEVTFDAYPAGYGAGGPVGSATILIVGISYGISMTVTDQIGAGLPINFYWEFADSPIGPAGGGGGGGGGGFGGGWVDPGPVLGPVFPNLLVKQYKTPRREGNVYDCCLERFYKLVNGAAIDYHPKACNMVETENGYMFPELGKEFWRRGVIPTPAIIDGDVQVMSLRVPDGYNGLIYGISCRYSGAGFVDGGGDIEWRLQVGPVWVRDMGRVLFQLGSPNQPLQLSDHIRVRSAQTIRWIVNAPNGSGVIVPGLTRITCTIQGWFYPMNRKR